MPAKKFFRVRNESYVSIDIATSWNRIIQQYENKILPGETKQIHTAVSGVQDFTVAFTVANEDGFNHKGDVGRGFVTGLEVFMTGTAVVGAVYGVTEASVAAIMGSAFLTGIDLTTFVVELASVKLTDYTFKGLGVMHDYEVVVRGGKPKGNYSESENKLVITGFEPLEISLEQKGNKIKTKYVNKKGKDDFKWYKQAA